METFKKVKLSFKTRNCCIINVPPNTTNIHEFIIDKIVDADFEKFVDEWIDFEIETLEFNEEEGAQALSFV